MEEFLKTGEEKKLKEAIEKGEKLPDFWYYFPRELGKDLFATSVEIAKSLIKAPFKITKTFAYHPLYYRQKEPEWKVPGLGEITSYAQDTEKRLKELQDQGMDDRTAAIATILGVGGEAILDVSIVAGWLESGAKAVAQKLTPELQEKVAAWKLLGEPDTPEIAQKTYDQLAHQFHPDKLGGDEVAMKQLNNAYEIISAEGGIPTAKELLTAKAARVGQAMISPISKIMELPKPEVTLPFKLLPEKAGYVPEEPFKPYYEPAMGLSIKPTPMKPVVPPAVAKEGAEGVKEIIQYELPANLMPVRGLPTWKHSKILWNTMRNQFGQANKLGEDMTRNRGTVAWIIDTLEGGERELAPLTEKYAGQAMTRKQYGKLYAMFKAHDYNIEGYKKVMATLKGIEPVRTTITAPVKEVAKAKELQPLAQEVRKMEIMPINQAIKKFDETGSVAIAKRADGVRLVMKDEGEFVKVGIDTGKLVSTDIKLPEKNFATKEEAFNFVRQLGSKKLPASVAMEGVPSITPTEGGFLAKKADGTQQLFKDHNKAYKFLEIEKPVAKAEKGTISKELQHIAKLDEKAKNLFIKRQGKEAYESGQIGETLERIEQKAEAYDPVFLKQHPEIKGHNITVYHDPIAGEDLAVIDNTTNKIIEILNKELAQAVKGVKEVKPNEIVLKVKETAPKQLRLDEAKLPPPGKPPVPEETPLAEAPEPPKGSGIETIDKMVGKISKPKKIIEWFKSAPKNFTALFTDRFSAIKKFEDNISKMAGKQIDINASPYVEARMYAGRVGTIEMNLLDLQRTLKPISKYRPDFTRFVLSKRAAERASRGFQNPAGVTEEQATRALAEIKEKVGEKVYGLFEATEGAIQNWADKTILKPALDSGIISKKAYEAIVAKNKSWLPFQVIDYLPTATQADMIPTGSEVFSVGKQGIIKGLKGTEKTIRDPFEAIIDRMSESVNLTQRNEVAKKLIDLRKEFPEAKELIKPLARTSKKGELVWDLKPQKGWDSISVFINGKSTKWAVPEDLGWAMHQMSPAEAGMVSNLVRFTSAAFRKGATNLYIPFSLSNAFRDAQMAIMCSKWGFNPADWLKGFGSGLKGAFGWESKLFEEFHRNAGGYGGFIQTAREISGVKKALFAPSWWTKTKAVINPFNLISNFAEAIELAPRLGVYAKGLKKGATSFEAAFEARRVTIDFARAGQEARIINSWIPFVNARWQALLNTARVFKDHPFRSAARVMALVVAPGVATYLWNTTNYPDLYDDIPQWAKDTYFIVIVGEDTDEKGNRVPKIVQIPKGDVGQIFYNPIEYALDYVRKGEPQNFAKLAIEWMSQVSPIPFSRDGEISATQFLSGGLPPLLRTPIELATNQSFFAGYPIVPRGLEQVAPSEQYDEKTPQLAIDIGRALGISPMKLAYGVNGMLGGFGREAIDPSKILELSVQRFYRTSGGAKRNEAWNLLDDLTVGYNTARVQAKRAIEQGQPEAADALMKEWNSKAESVIPDITNIIAEDDPEEAQSIAKKITFQATDIARLKKTVQEEIAEIKKTPTATSKEGYWGAESAPTTMGEMLPAKPTAKVATGYWK